MKPRAFVGLAVLLGVLVDVRAMAVGSIYDQRQQGDVNVQIDVKDVRIVALVDSEMLEDYTNYDYAYDYADFTIKPSTRPTTTSMPASNSTVEPSSTLSNDASTAATSSNSTAPSSLSSSSNDESSSTEVTSTTANSNSSDATEALTTQSIIVKISSQIANTTEGERKRLVSIEEATTTTTTVAATIAVQVVHSNLANETTFDGVKRPMGIAEPRKKCPLGFLLKSGRCFKRRLSFISPRNAIIKLAPTLLAASQKY